MLRCTLLSLFWIASAGSLSAQDQPWSFEDIALPGGETLRAAVVRPEGFERSRPYPVLLALPPGAQNRAMVEAGLLRHWGRQARERGWVVISPVAADGESFYTGGERAIGGLLRWIRIHFTVEGNRLHLAGASNGGRSAFRVALEHSYQFASLTVLPGYPPASSDRQRLGRLRDLGVHMFVGGADQPWREKSESAAERLRELEVAVTHRVLEGEGHVPPSLDGTVVIEHLQRLRPRAPADPTVAAVHALLDDFNDAAAKADAARYFGLFSPDGVFLGTDATERWTVPEFREYAAGAFERESAWIYVPVRRHVAVAPGGEVAWFDEVVGNAAFGECRGTGTARVVDGQWRVAHYNLTVPIPNDLLYGVAEQIRVALDPASEPATTTVYVVRHAEKAKGDDPQLTAAGRERAQALVRMLRDARVTAIYTTGYRRNRQTVAPLATALKIEAREYDARATRSLVELIRREERGGTVVVCGHSNTVIPILRRLGCEAPERIGESDYDDLFEVTIDARGHASVRHLHYGAGNPGS